MLCTNKTLIIGDSNTWGFDAQEFARSGAIQKLGKCWVDLLKESITDEFKSISVSALNGRTIEHEDTDWPGRNLDAELAGLLKENSEVDTIVIFLGLNDFKSKYNLPFERVIESYRKMICTIQGEYETEGLKIIIVSPPIIKHESAYDAEFSGAIEKITSFNKHLKLLAKEKACYFLDSNDVPFEMTSDGIHFTEKDHENFFSLISSILIPTTSPLMRI